MKHEEFAVRVEAIRTRLFKTAMLYLADETAALDAVGDTVYKALKGLWRLRDPELFNTWITRILINECYSELRRQKKALLLEEADGTVEMLDTLPLKEAIRRLPKDLRDIVILRYFGGYTVSQTAQILKIPPGTAATRQRKALALLRLELTEEVET